MQDYDLVFKFRMARKDSSNGGQPNNYTVAVLKGDSIANIASPIGEKLGCFLGSFGVISEE
ncbi:hypothetical protein CRV24_007259 [Beauveria bassiana]|nr:hypothetical protein CRV24_007259 [Beauveria bassiana]KAH8712570.1 hypothetical protein HC256_005754 [Beauveria bassiana]